MLVYLGAALLVRKVTWNQIKSEANQSVRSGYPQIYTDLLLVKASQAKQSVHFPLLFWEGNYTQWNYPQLPVLNLPPPIAKHPVFFSEVDINNASVTEYQQPAALATKKH